MFFKAIGRFAHGALSNAPKSLICLSIVGLISAPAGAGPGMTEGQKAGVLKRTHPSNTLPLTSFYDVQHPLPLGKPGELIRSESINQYSLPYELSAFRMLYHSRTSHGEDVAVSGVVLIPDGKPPVGGWPVIAWAHEFRGTGRQCAPSLLRNLGVGPLLAMYANLGYAVVASDYAGLGTDSGKPVVDMQSNALDVSYAVIAARTAIKEIGPKWIAVGAFQGALASVAIAENEAHDPNQVGSIATSGLADEQSADERMVIQSPARAMLIIGSTLMNLYPEFRLNYILKDEGVSGYNQAIEGCGAGGDSQLGGKMLKADWENNHFVMDYFAKNTPGQKQSHAPLLVISGEIDPVTRADTIPKTITGLCKQGDRVLYLKYPDVDEGSAIGASIADQISWIKARFAGDTSPSNCH
jgi:hypothetical protein